MIGAFILQAALIGLVCAFIAVFGGLVVISDSLATWRVNRARQRSGNPTAGPRHQHVNL